MKRLALLISTALMLVFAAPASAYMHAANCLDGLLGANGDDEIGQTYPFDVGGNWVIDTLVLSRSDGHNVAFSWRWVDGVGGLFWNSGECVGDDWSYVDRLIGPGR